MTQPAPQTLFEKVWNNHVVAKDEGAPYLLYIDRHLIHEVTSPQAFTTLRQRGLQVRRPDRTIATMDHSIPTLHPELPIRDAQAAKQVQTLMDNCREFGITLYDLKSSEQGIVHIIGPELGITQPGMTIVCGDSHTSTHGAFGALAFGIGTSEVGFVLATQCLLQDKPKTFEVRIDGTLGTGVTAKDIILTIIRHLGVGGGVGHVFEYTGSLIRSLSMEQRMTICNMSIEGGARAGMIAPDETTIHYVRGRRFAPQGEAFEQAAATWRSLATDAGAKYDKTVAIDGNDIEPMVTYGTNPGQAIKITERVPDPAEMANADDRRSLEKALAYMNLKPKQWLAGFPVDYVFIGSCTNSRIEDLRAAAQVVQAAVSQGKRVDSRVKALVVPGSKQVKATAEAEGLDRIFTAAGFEWRGAGCSMCLAMNDDKVPAGQYCASTSNRNFEGRQGKGSRTFLLSPQMAAAAALNGRLVDVREIS